MRFLKQCGVAIIVVLTVAACATKPKLTPQELAALRGGKTTVVAYFECAPINYITGGMVAKHSHRIYVDDQVVASIVYCGHTTFTLDSGQRQFSVENLQSLFNPKGVASPMTFRPGKTQYLKIYYLDGNMLLYKWVSKSEADQEIAAIKKIKPVF